MQNLHSRCFHNQNMQEPVQGRELLQAPGRMIPAERFMEKIWGYDADAQAHVVWVYISYLRRKLQTLQANVQIRVVRGVGYTLEAIT